MTISKKQFFRLFVILCSLICLFALSAYSITTTTRSRNSKEPYTFKILSPQNETEVKDKIIVSISVLNKGVEIPPEELSKWKYFCFIDYKEVAQVMDASKSSEINTAEIPEGWRLLTINVYNSTRSLGILSVWIKVVHE